RPAGRAGGGRGRDGPAPAGRDRGRPGHAGAWRSLAADRRERRDVRAPPGRRGARNRLQGARRLVWLTALALVRQYQPSAITLDLSLPDMEGWRVLERLKGDFETRHLPVTVITTGEDLRRGRSMGAFAALGKPVKTREVLRAALGDLMSI